VNFSKQVPTAPALNQLCLSAQVVQWGEQRFTPAGLEALDVQLLHVSTQTEDGHARKVHLDIKALALGEMVKKVQQLRDAGDQSFLFKGFLSSFKTGRGITFHIVEIDLLKN
jgi:primosomal replication protein N